jgi:hypothetical protein
MIELKGSWGPCMPMPQRKEFWVGIILGAIVAVLILRFVV